MPAPSTAPQLLRISAPTATRGPAPSVIPAAPDISPYGFFGGPGTGFFGGTGTGFFGGLGTGYFGGSAAVRSAWIRYLLTPLLVDY